MRTPNWVIKWAERLIQVKEIFKRSGQEITDEVALKIITLLKREDIMNNESFQKMAEFAVQIYIMNISGNLSESIKELQAILNELENLPEKREHKDTEKTKLFKERLKKYFKVISDDDLGKILGVSGQAISKLFLSWFLAQRSKSKYRLILEDPK